MEKKITEAQIKELASRYGYSYAALRAVMQVEGQGQGFSDTTGKILIQFEPSWYKRQSEDWLAHSKGTTWINNKVENQTGEWKAFNEAFKFDDEAAMKSTSIGAMQVMGFHYQLLGFKTVGEMWDFAKVSEANQIELGVKFIKSNPKLDKALKTNDWKTFAYYYNGEQYTKYKYDTKLATAYNKFK